MLAATFDIGTTAVKAVVVNENGEPVFTGSSVIHTIETGNFKEQDPDEWYGAFCTQQVIKAPVQMLQRLSENSVPAPA